MNNEEFAKVVIPVETGIQNQFGKSWTPASAGVTAFFLGFIIVFQRTNTTTLLELRYKD